MKSAKNTVQTGVFFGDAIRYLNPVPNGLGPKNIRSERKCSLDNGGGGIPMMHKRCKVACSLCLDLACCQGCPSSLSPKPHVHARLTIHRVGIGCNEHRDV